MITQEMAFVRIEDIAAYAEARAVLRVVGPAPELSELRYSAMAVCAALAEALRAGAWREELRRLRDATIALTEVRRLAWEALERGRLDARRFDDVVLGSARCEREVLLMEAASRHRTRREVDAPG